MVFGLASSKIQITDNWKKIEVDIMEESIASNTSAVNSLREYLHRIRNPTPTERPEGVTEYHGVYGWASGGGLPILNTRDGSYVVLIYRDENAPTYPNTFTLTSGLSESWKEIQNLRTLAMRETIEEILLSDGVNWLIPQTSADILSPEYMESIIREKVTDWEDKPSVSLTETDFSEVNVSSQPLNSDSLVLNYGGDITTISGHFVIDNKYNMIDLIDIIHFDLSDYSINELKIYDGGRADGRLLNRDIHLIELSELASIIDGPLMSRYVYNSGERIVANVTSENPTTLVGESSVKSLASSELLPLK